MSLPQLLMPGHRHQSHAAQFGLGDEHLHPFLPGAEVPGAPVSDLETTQKSSVVPHWPQMLQQTFSGHGLSEVKFVPCGGRTVSGIFYRYVSLGK